MKMINKKFLVRFLKSKSLIVFCVVSTVLLFTARWSLGIWDSPEFAFAGANFQITHAPGAPFYILILNTLQGVLFFIAPYKVAVLLSILCFSVMAVYLFKTALLICSFYIKPQDEKSSKPWLYAIIAVVIGCCNLTLWELSYEVEVYSMSGLFLSLVFYKIFRYHSDQITIITFVKVVSVFIFLSLGVHKLNLLILLPVFYILIRKAGYKNIFRFKTVALLSSVVAMAAIVTSHSLFLKSVAAVALFFEDTLNTSQNVAFPVLGLSLFLITALLWYYKRAIGISIVTASLLSYLLYLPFLNTAPQVGGYQINNTLSLIEHIEASQFGLQKTPLFFGTRYDDALTNKTNREVDFLPRMHSTNAYDLIEYPKWDDSSIRKNHNGSHFFWGYQVYSLYVRYLGTNFIGRSNVHKNSGTSINHSVSSSIYNTNPLDSYFKIGAVDYLGIPLLFVLLGILYSFKNIDIGIILGLSFLITGLAIMLYLNPPPSSLRVRERDYISFFSFVICGFYAMLGVVAISNFLPKGKNVFAIGTGVFALLFVVQNYWIQDKSDQNFNEVFSSWILETIPNRSIVFANGDNLTFPYWYQLANSERPIYWINIELLHVESYEQQLLDYFELKNGSNNVVQQSTSDLSEDQLKILETILPDNTPNSQELRSHILGLLENDYDLFLQSNWAAQNQLSYPQATVVPYFSLSDRNLEALALKMLALKASSINGIETQEMNLFLDFYVKKSNALVPLLIDNDLNDLAAQLSDNTYQFYKKFDLPKDGSAFNVALRLYNLGENSKAETLMKQCINENSQLLRWLIENRNPLNVELTIEKAQKTADILDAMLDNYNKINQPYVQSNIIKIQDLNKNYLTWRTILTKDD